MVAAGPGSRCRDRMLRTTSAEWTPSERASAQAASTAAKPSVSTADSTLTIWRSPSSEPCSLRRRRSRLAGKSQCLNGALLRDRRDEKPYCLTEKCSQDVERCLTKHAPVASLASGRATAPLPFHKSMLTDVGPVELWATPLRRPSAAANPQGSSRRLDDR